MPLLHPTSVSMGLFAHTTDGSTSTSIENRALHTDCTALHVEDEKKFNLESYGMQIHHGMRGLPSRATQYTLSVSRYGEVNPAHDKRNPALYIRKKSVTIELHTQLNPKTVLNMRYHGENLSEKIIVLQGIP